MNCHLWDLGPDVLIGVADTLADPDWTRQAARDRAAAIKHRGGLFRAARTITAGRDAEALIARADPESPVSGAPVPATARRPERTRGTRLRHQVTRAPSLPRPPTPQRPGAPTGQG